MYCIKCGVELSEGEKRCPLCQTSVYHPELPLGEKSPTFPVENKPKKEIGSKFWQVVLTFAVVISLLTVTLCDFQINDSITWSGYVIGALLLFSVALVVPLWFKRPNPVIFVPCTFGAAGVYLLYINFVTKGDWFLTFALPVTAAIGLAVTTVVTLMKYVYKGRFFTFGGAFLFLGIFMPATELLMTLTFEKVHFIGWSFYPLMVFVLLGGFLIFLGICRPARESMERKFFV